MNRDDLIELTRLLEASIALLDAGMLVEYEQNLCRFDCVLGSKYGVKKLSSPDPFSYERNHCS